MQKLCQSCGMPLNRDPQQGGTNADGTTSEVYCGYCYQSGAFTKPDLTLTDMMRICDHKMKDMGIPKVLRWLYKRHIPKLKRWTS